MTARPSPQRLADAGIPYVTLHALRQYVAQSGRCDAETARRDLTRLVARAHRVKAAKDGMELWRVRERNADLTLRVARDHDLLVVVSVGRLRTA